MKVDIPILVVGGGPVGLVLAHELQRHGVKAMLIERNAETTQHPKMDVTNARGMELLRRLGLSERLRDAAVPQEHPLSVIWMTKIGEGQLARFDYPSVNEGKAEARRVNDGTYPLEPNMRISQAELEPILKNALEKDCKLIDVRFGWELVKCTQDKNGVTSTLKNKNTGERQTMRSQYLAGCDGANSVVRENLSIALDETSLGELVSEAGGAFKNISKIGRGLLRGESPNDGRVYIVHFRSPAKDLFERFGPCWHAQLPSGATIISQNDQDIWTLHAPLKAGQNIQDIEPEAFLHDVIGQKIECEILLHNEWRPSLALAQSYGHGRIWLAGDSTHQMIPTGGYGMNTGIGDAAGLGWALAANVQGWGKPKLLSAYEAERRPVAKRNITASKQHMAVRYRIIQAAQPKIYRSDPAGAAARRTYGAYIQSLGNMENEALGLELGFPYEASPVICHEDTSPPLNTIETYTPSTFPGGRPPSLYLEDDTAIFDKLVTGFTLLRFADIDVSTFIKAAKARALPLTVIDIRDAHASVLYEKPLVLIRPDQHVAWRGDVVPKEPEIVIDKIRGG